MQPYIRETTHPLIGIIRYQIIGTPSNPDAVRLLDMFEQHWMQRIDIPFLKDIPGAPHCGRVYVNTLAAPTLIAALTTLRKSDAWPDIITWDGIYCPRVARGTKTILSAHALGLAVDMNAEYNPRGTDGPGLGRRGDMTRIAEVFKAFGWRWGADFPCSDRMHLEYVGSHCYADPDK